MYCNLDRYKLVEDKSQESGTIYESTIAPLDKMPLDFYEECAKKSFSDASTMAVTAGPGGGTAAPLYSVVQLCPWALNQVRDFWLLFEV
jgi:hypothetical protein